METYGFAQRSGIVQSGHNIIGTDSISCQKKIYRPGMAYNIYQLLVRPKDG